MIKVSIIGPGDINLHCKIIKMSEDNLKTHIDEVAKALSESSEIAILPDKGIPIEVAKKYKEYFGSKVYGNIPRSDKDIGIKHLEPYINIKVNEKPLIDEEFDTESWYKQDLIHAITADCTLVLGYSLGGIGELAYGLYLYRLFGGKNAGSNTFKSKVHKQIISGNRIPFKVLVYKPFVKEELIYEIEQYAKESGVDIIYLKDSNELRKILNLLNKEMIK